MRLIDIDRMIEDIYDEYGCDPIYFAGAYTKNGANSDIHMKAYCDAYVIEFLQKYYENNL
jgi:hypothetical protein